MVFLPYILQQRLIIAARLSQTDHDTIEEIAIKTGFMSNSYFTKSFKNMFGIVPSLYQMYHSKK